MGQPIVTAVSTGAELAEIDRAALGLEHARPGVAEVVRRFPLAERDPVLGEQTVEPRPDPPALPEGRAIDARRLDRLAVLAIARGRPDAHRGLIPIQARTRLQRPHGLRTVGAGLCARRAELCAVGPRHALGAWIVGRGSPVIRCGGRMAFGSPW